MILAFSHDFRWPSQQLIWSSCIFSGFSLVVGLYVDAGHPCSGDTLNSYLSFTIFQGGKIVIRITKLLQQETLPLIFLIGRRSICLSHASIWCVTPKSLRFPWFNGLQWGPSNNDLAESSHSCFNGFFQVLSRQEADGMALGNGAAEWADKKNMFTFHWILAVS